MMKILRIQYILVLALLCGSLLLPAGVVQAQESTTAQAESRSLLQIIAEADGVRFAWNARRDASGAVSAASVESMLAELPATRYNGYLLPMRTQSVIVPAFVDLQPRIERLETQAWSTPLAQAPALSPPALDWEDEYESPVESFALPSAPVFVLRRGQVRGQDVAVIGFSPIFEEAGQLRVATDLSVLLPGVRALDGGLVQLLAEQKAQRETEIAAQATSTTANTAADTTADTTGANAELAPTNPAASTDSIKIMVNEPGIQVLSGQSLINTGLNPAVSLARLHLTYRGTEVPLDIRGTSLANSEIRFFAPAPEHSNTMGDRWNAVDVFWLTHESTNGQRMSTRTAAGEEGVLTRSFGVARGIWENNQLYESTMPGADGDYWFAEQMDADPSQANNPSAWPSVAVNVKPDLPLAASPALTSIFTVTGSTRTISTNQLRATLGSDTQTMEWASLQYYLSFQEAISSTVHAGSLTLTLIPSDQPTSIRLDKVYWEQPVSLNFGGGGAAFSGVEGMWRYQLQNLPTTRTLYDVTDPLAPQIIDLPGGSSAEFQDGPDAKAYVLAGTGTEFTPDTETHSPVSLTSILDKDVLYNAVYVAPANFHDELEPLLAQRRQQGYKVAVVDVQEIYDLWSFSLVDPEAIRSFFRYANSLWGKQFISAVLVGDGTSDPRNYRGFLDGTANADIIPAYVAHVDPWLGETACENCYVQLDGADPLSAENDEASLPDLWLGRFSVQDEAQLTDVVNKLLRYENADDIDLGARWRQTSFYYTEEYTRADGSKDPAGNFQAFSDEIIEHFQSPDLLTERVYYDPSPDGGQKPWLEPDAAQARRRTINAYSDGAGLVFYNGHANHWQHGSTDKNVSEPYMFGYNDIFQLTNADQLPIILEMTCFTGQFTKVSTTGTTMDERFQRYGNGGGIAILAPAGLTVAHGHDMLMKGFHEVLWSQPAFSTRLGELIEGSYMRLFLGEEGSGTCCQDARLTFLLLGDPLMPVLVRDAKRLNLPIIEQPDAPSEEGTETP